MQRNGDSDGTNGQGRIDYTVWSRCRSVAPNAPAGEVNFLEEAFDGDSKRVRENFPCPHCDAQLTKKKPFLYCEA